VAALGTVSLLDPQALLEPSRLGVWVLGGVTAFWGLRLLFQLFVYKPEIWRGNGFRTFFHVAFTAFWVYVVVIYASALRIQLGG
jgi:hypothetical protein